MSDGLGGHRCQEERRIFIWGEVDRSPAHGGEDNRNEQTMPMEPEELAESSESSCGLDEIAHAPFSCKRLRADEFAQPLLCGPLEDRAVGGGEAFNGVPECVAF